MLCLPSMLSVLSLPLESSPHRLCLSVFHVDRGQVHQDRTGRIVHI
jgi:hypothetical protein